MVRPIAERLHAHADRLKRHPNRLVRRTAQLAVLGFLAVRLRRLGFGRPSDSSFGSQEQLIGNPSFSLGVRDYLASPGFLRPRVGLIARLLVLLEAADRRMRELAQADHRTFIMPIGTAIDQATLRNLLVWQNHVLNSYPGCGDGRSVDLMLMLTGPAAHGARLFDLISTALMLERIRNVAVHWDAESLQRAVPLSLSAAEQARWSTTKPADDLGKLPPEIIASVECDGTSGGVKLLPDGRKRAQDFFKAAFPGKFIFAVAMRENQDGAVEPDELDLWLPLFDAVADRHPTAAFVVLSRIDPSQWRALHLKISPSHVRFARHQGLSLQDALCLAQVADGYVGALDIFGFAANAAGRPGVYVPLTDVQPGESAPPGEASAQVMVCSRDRGRIEAALERFLAGLSRTAAGALRG